MVKKAAYMGGAFVLLMSLLFGRDAFSYVSTSLGWMKATVRESVPIHFEIERARRMISELEPEVRRNMHVIAKEAVEVERLESQVSELQNRLSREESEIEKLNAHFQSGKDYFEHAGVVYSNADVHSDLTNRWERFKTNTETVENLKKILSSRRQSLNAARTKLEQMLAARRSLSVNLENLEARQKMVEVAQTASDINFDDSQLARTKELISNIRTRIDVDEKLAHVQTDFHAGIPLDEPSTEISAEIAQYFQQRKDTALGSLAGRE
jgi:phage shock protein A